MLYIPWANHTVDSSNVQTIAMCLKNLRNVKVHLSPANSESMNEVGTVKQTTYAFNSDNSLGKPGKVCIINVVFSVHMLILLSQIKGLGLLLAKVVFWLGC
jgi:hypothetical protein